MSVRATTAVWAHSQQKGSDLLVTLALANWAAEDGTAWATIGRLAAQVRLTEKHVRSVLAKLERSGEVAIERGAGRLIPATRGRAAYQTDLYRICLPGVADREPRKTFPNLERKSGNLTPEVGKSDAEVGKSDAEVGKSAARIKEERTERTESTESTHTPRARGGAGCGSIIAKGEAVLFDRALERQHVTCHPEVCRWRDPLVRVCMPRILVDELAAKLHGLPRVEAIADVIAWARQDTPPAGSVDLGDTFAHWRGRWTATRSTPLLKAPRGSVGRVPRGSTPVPQRLVCVKCKCRAVDRLGNYCDDCRQLEGLAS